MYGREMLYTEEKTTTTTTTTTVLPFFAVFGESKPSLYQYKTMGKRFVGFYLEP
jgi:hypothetical protein